MGAPYPHVMDVYARRRFWLHELLKEHSAAYLSERSGMAASTISRLKLPPDQKHAKNIGERSARRLESAGHKSSGWLDRQHWIAGESSPAYAVDQDLSQPTVEHAPQIDWEALMEHKTLPALFWITINDDAMAPRVRAGNRVCFDSRQTPRAGDGVLLVDEAGTFQFRMYRAASADRWIASALNPAFAERDSAKDPIRVVAVLVAEEGRWT
jgi:hypothetical protein